MRKVDPAFVQDILDLTQTERKSDVIHHGQLDDFETGFEVLEWGTLAHPPGLRGTARSRQVPLTGPFLVSRPEDRAWNANEAMDVFRHVMQRTFWGDKTV